MAEFWFAQVQSRDPPHMVKRCSAAWVPPDPSFSPLKGLLIMARAKRRKEHIARKEKAKKAREDKKAREEKKVQEIHQDYDNLVLESEKFVTYYKVRVLFERVDLDC